MPPIRPVSGDAFIMPIAAALLTLLTLTHPASAQQQNPVYVDDSPRAAELLRLARQQANFNPPDAVRLYQELLDDYPLKLVAIDDQSADHFVSVRRRVLNDLLDDPPLLELYRRTQTPHAQHLLDDGRLHLLARTRTLTTPGLTALLRLAQDDLEDARFHACLHRLESALQHPDLHGRDAAYAWYLRSLANHFLNRHDYADRDAAALAKLAGDDAAECLDHLNHLRDAAVPPAPAPGLTPLTATSTLNLDNLLDQPVWSVPLTDSLLNRRRRDPSARRLRPPGFPSIPAETPDHDFATIAPTLADGTLYINQGRSFLALDPFTGQILFTRPCPHHDLQHPSDLDPTPPADLNLIAVQDDCLVSFVGHAYPTGRSGGDVICLDVPSGRLRWAVNLDRIADNDEYAGLFPHGMPVILEDRVCLLARKISPQLIAACYVLALDLHDGSLQWIRHVASCASREVTRPFSSLCLADGELYLATSIGAVARLQPASGSFRWLRRYNAPLTIPRRRQRPWQLAAPVVARDRVFAIRPDLRRILVLDRHTGAQLQSHDAMTRDRWGAPDYLLTDGQRLYAVGREIHAFELDNLRQPLWSLPSPDHHTSDLPQPVESLDILGRVQHVGHALIVPTRREALIVDDATGRILRRLHTTSPGNPLAVGPQCLIASADSLDNYMSFQSARRLLRERTAANPADPRPAIALLRIATRVDDLPLAREAADLALRAAELAADETLARETRDSLFRSLMQLHQRRLDHHLPPDDDLYSLMARIARTPTQTADLLIARGDRYRSHDPAQSVASWQTILADPSLRDLPREEDGLLRPASHWAAQRIDQLIDHHGPQLYDQFDRAARDSFANLPPAQRDDPEALRAHAIAWPFADSSFDAALRAAELLVDAGHHRRAIALLNESFLLAPAPERARRLLAPSLRIALDHHLLHTARALLNVLSRQCDNLTLQSPTGPQLPADWLAQLPSDPPQPRLPRIGDRALAARQLPGRILCHDNLCPLPPDRALILDEHQLSLLTADDLAPLWTASLDRPNARLLSFSNHELLLGIGAQFDDPRIIALDPQTGRLQSSTTRLSELIDEPLARHRAIADHMPDGAPFDPMQTLPLVGPRTLYLVQRTGGVAAFDRRRPRIHHWARDETLPRVHLAAPLDFALVLAGLDHSASPAAPDDMQPCILTLDPQSGAILNRITLSTDSGVIWLLADPFATLLAGADEGIEAIDLLTGRQRWLNRSPIARETPCARDAPPLAIVQSRDGSLFSINFLDGHASPPFPNRVRGDWSALLPDDFRLLRDSVLVRYRDRVIRHDFRGNLLGADAVTDNRDYRLLLPARDRLILVSQLDSRQVVLEGETLRRTLRTYRIYLLSRNGKMLGDVIELPPQTDPLRHALVIDDWLLLAADSRTIALQLPAPHAP